MKIKIFALFLLLAMVLCGGGGIQAAAESYEPGVNYLQEIIDVLRVDGPQAMEAGAEFESLRNLKIDGECRAEQKTDYFRRLNTPEEILRAIENDSRIEGTSTEESEAQGENAGAEGNGPGYTEADLYWLSRVINAEAGGSWMPDWLQRAVGSVVLNRVNAQWYPNSIEEVVFQTGQYACTTNGSIYEEPARKAVENARYLLENGSTLPAGVLGQSEFVQGEIYSTYDDPYLATTTYFCYL